MRTRGAVVCVRNTPTGLPLWMSSVSSFSSLRSAATIASNASQLRAAFPVPPYTTRSSGRSATSGSRLFISMRRAASCCQPLQESVVPRGARTMPRRVLLLRVRFLNRRRHCANRSFDVGAGISSSAIAFASRSMSGDNGRSRSSGATSLAHRFVRARHAAPRLERRAAIDALRRTHELDREHVSHVAHDAPQFPRRRHRHRHDVFLVAVGRNRVDARRVREHLALAGDRRRGDLRHHESGIDAGVVREERRKPLIQIRIHEAIGATLGNCREVGERDGEEIERHRDRLAVKVAAAEQDRRSRRRADCRSRR